jgi:hypothetical protein
MSRLRRWLRLLLCGARHEYLGFSAGPDFERKITVRMNAPECLEGLAKFRDPVAIITKNQLVARDIDSLCELENHKAIAVNLSLTSLDPNLQRVLAATDAVLSCTPRCDQACSCGESSSRCH